jgi:hypothetical protein
MTRYLRGLWRTRMLRWRRIELWLMGFPYRFAGLQSTLAELIENEMNEEFRRP